MIIKKFSFAVSTLLVQLSSSLSFYQTLAKQLQEKGLRKSGHCGQAVCRADSEMSWQPAFPQKTFKLFSSETEIIVVDNNSSDRGVEFLRKNYYEIKVEGGADLGCAYGCSPAVKSARISDPSRRVNST